MDVLSSDIIQSIVNADCDDIFAYLGSHKINQNLWVVRVFLPNADKIEVVDYQSRETITELERVHEAGLYIGSIEREDLTRYLFRVTYEGHSEILEDPYRFGSSIGEQDLYLYGEGTHESAYQFLGAHLMSLEGVDGCRFCVWAPNARRVSVVGDFNYWDGRKNMMRKHIPSGIWEVFIPAIEAGALYKYEIRNAGGDLLPHKADPFGFAAQCPPDQASVVADINAYDWNDQEWDSLRHKHTQRDSAISIYEIHLGSWQHQRDGFLNYRELADKLISYVKYMGYTHIQLMPVSEFPFDGSWGYQPVGLYAPTSRFGSPTDFKYFVDKCHQAEIAVLIDWVPGHFPTDGHGLGRFDGSPLYEHADAKQGFHPDWNTYIYNYGRKEVANFLMANALFWFDQYHIDGLRVDAVASMLYLDYSRDDGEWIPNQYGGRENLDAIDFLRSVNERVYRKYPDAMMIAEESTAWPGVSKPVHFGGLGFGFKWNMGWMNDSLEYMSREPIHRQHHHHDMTFSLYYAFSENFILPLSHDEVVHGKGSILSRMPGDVWQQFANLRAYYAFMWGHPGKKLLFMGNDFGQGPEWDHDNGLPWYQLEVAEHKGVQNLVRDLNNLYVSREALHHHDSEGRGFEWIEADDRHNSVFAFIRKSEVTGHSVLVVTNFTPECREEYRVGINEPGYYKEILNSDSEIYGGTNKGCGGGVCSEPVEWHHRENSIRITLPPLATVIFELQ